MNLLDFKKACKANRCSVTNACHTILGKSVKEYSDAQGDKKLSAITIGSTFSTKPFPKTIEDVYPRNTWVPQYLRLPVGHNFKDLLK